MRKQDLRAAETLHFLENNDINPGFRRLLDCVADTQDMELYRQAVALTDWKEQHPDEQAEYIEKAKALLQKTEE
ncbi:hypothetical protein LWM68_43575 [Niabella sp. W65]|nr:hypothetical protein [Niabella sp. W65]MCH7369011.1 hypothetical protein [Niabella sp. W65]